jgi:hypothetical protein
MKTNVLQIFAAGMMWVLSSSVCNAITITMGTYNVGLGDTVNQAIIISGLGDNTAPSVGAFDINVSYNADFLQYSGVTFGNGLDVLAFGSLQDVFSSSGLVNLIEVSLDTVADLDSLQSYSFTLATLLFDPLQNGRSELGVSGIISDAAGFGLQVDFQAGSVTVPEPSTMFFMAMGLVGIILTRRKIS